MKSLFASLAILLAAAPAAQAQTAGAAAPATAAKYTLDTPIETLIADPAAKAVLDADLPGVSTHPSLAMFQAMSLRQLQPYSDGKLPDDLLAKVEADLAKVQ